MNIAPGYRKMRWVIFGWLTLSVILNVIDKQALSLLSPVLRAKFHIGPEQYANIVAAFLLSYTVMYAVGGKFVDRVGERLGMAACILWWSVCTICLALTRGFYSLRAVQFLLGLGEPGNYPAALRATARWFPKSERSLPVAVFSSGGAVGNIIAPPLIAGLMLTFGWQAAFIVPGALGLVWLAVWLVIYRLPSQYKHFDPEDVKELEDLDKDTKGKGTPWLGLLKDRGVLGLVLSRFVSDPVWQFCTFWIPAYLAAERGFSMADIGKYAWIPHVAGAIGGMTGGRVSDMLIRRGLSPIKVRAKVLYIGAAIAPLGILTARVHSAAVSIAMMAALAFVAYVWFITTAAMIPDLVPGRVVGSVLGFVGTAGTCGGILFMKLVGYLVSHYSYKPVFAIAGCLHVLGALILWAMLRGRTSTETPSVVPEFVEEHA